MTHAKTQRRKETEEFLSSSCLRAFVPSCEIFCRFATPSHERIFEVLTPKFIEANGGNVSSWTYSERSEGGGGFFFHTKARRHEGTKRNIAIYARSQSPDWERKCLGNSVSQRCHGIAALHDSRYKLHPRTAKRSFGDKCVPNQEIGNERKGKPNTFLS